MRIQLLKENFHQGVNIASRLAATKAQLPILGQVGIEATEEGIFLMATDLEVGVRLRVRGKVMEVGGVAVPAKLLAELVAALPLGAVEIMTEKGESLKVQAGKVQALIRGMSLAEFPTLVDGGGKKIGQIKVGEMKKVLGRVGFSVSKDESRPVLTGVLWEIKKGNWVATDGYRLSVTAAGIEPSKEMAGREKLLISERVLAEGVRAFEEVGVETLNLTLIEATKQVVLEGEGLIVTGRLLEGEYPPYGGIVPGELTVTVAMERSEFSQAVKTAAIFARDSAHIIKLQIKKGAVIISANAPQVGDNQIEVEAETKGEGELTIAFNSHYLSDFLSHAASDRVWAGFTETLKPGVFWESEREDFQHVIMPVRVREGE